MLNLKYSFYLVVILTSCFCISACTWNNSKEKSALPEIANGNTKGQTTDETKNKLTDKRVYALGDTIISEGNWKCCLSNYEEGKLYNRNCLPQEGNKLIAIQVFFQNLSNEKVVYDDTYWKIADEEGFEYSVWGNEGCIGLVKEPEFSSGDLEPYQKKSGYTTFQAAKNVKCVELRFNPVPSSPSDRQTFSIKLKEKH